MSKKKLTIQQKTRIARKQQSFSTIQDTELMEGLVITRSKRHALIESLQNGQQMSCVIRPDIGSLVVGDHVYWKAIDLCSGVVESVLPRKNVLSRPDCYRHVKMMAANITQMIVVIATKPEPSRLLIDSYLVAAELMQVKVSIVFNKVDLDTLQLRDDFAMQYQNLCHAFVLNQSQDPNLVALQALLKNEISIFTGQSGVGKSTLIQLVIPNKAQDIATSPLSAIHEFGQHTTSNAHYFHLPFSGAIIDSPGIRSFGLSQISRQDLLWGFKEFRPFIGQCKFRDCNHQSAGYCAIVDAVKKGQISENRYENYVKMVAQYTF